MDNPTFGSWPSKIHTDPDQKKRQKSALDKNLTPLTVDHTENSAVFKGSSKSRYQTTLDTCTCVDYGMRKAPCKHIYRLAMELGKFPGIENAKSVNMKELIKREQDPRLSVDEVIEIISVLPKEDQTTFAYICYGCGNENKNGHVEGEGELIEWLIEHGLLCRDTSAENCLRYMKKDLILSLYSEICPIDKKMKKPEIVAEVVKHIDYYGIPEEYRRGLVYLDPKIDRDAHRIHRRILKMYPWTTEEPFF